MAEPANRYDRPGGGKIYRHPVTEEVFDSVTSVLESWDKDGLKIWAGQLAAAAALDRVPQLTAALILPDCGNTYNRCYQKHGRDARCERCPCRDCERCQYQYMAFRHQAESARRSAEGTEFHEAANYWVTSGGDRMSIHKEVEPYFESFLRWVADYGLTPASWEQTEGTVLNRQYMVAGTSDAALRIVRSRVVAQAAAEQVDRMLLSARGHRDAAMAELARTNQTVTVRVDYKTREKEDERLYNDMPLQGVAYERCDTMMLPDGREFPAPRTHVRAVLQLRPPSSPDGPYSFRPMVSDEPEWQAFLGLLVAYRWKQARGDKNAFNLDVALPVYGQAPPTEAELAAIQAFYGPAPTPPPPVAPPVKRTAKKAAAKKAVSATQSQDPFELAQQDNPDRSAILASMSRANPVGAFPAGQPELSGFDEPPPF